MRRFSAVFALMLLTVVGVNGGRSAIAAPPDRFPPNPLTLPVNVGLPRDLPSAPSPELRRQIETLNQQAIAQLQAGDAKAAFDLWNQQLRLSRVFGPIEEVKALAAVGQVAWDRGDTQQVRYISQRLQQIQTSSQTTSQTTGGSESLLTELAAAYQVIRAPELALPVYNQGVKQAQQPPQNPLRLFQLYNRIAQTHLDWFAYTKAAKVYGDLLAVAKTQNDRPNQMAYAYQLAYVHEQSKRPAGAIAALETLIPLYATSPEPVLLARLQTRLADQYRLNQQLDLAEKTYQAAYRSAEVQQQPGFGGDALRQLGSLYRQQKRLDAAIQVYDFLSTFETEAGLNRYNAMDAYDRLGQVWLEKQSKPQAIAAFQQGLQLAQGLNYRVAYFTDRLAKAQAAGSQ
jgi:tetratricopeptide (TPR) repeat protein